MAKVHHEVLLADTNSPEIVVVQEDQYDLMVKAFEVAKSVLRITTKGRKVGLDVVAKVHELTEGAVELAEKQNLADHLLALQMTAALKNGSQSQSVIFINGDFLIS